MPKRLISAHRKLTGAMEAAAVTFTRLTPCRELAILTWLITYLAEAHPRTENSHFLTRGDACEQPKNIQFPCIEMSR